MTEALEGQVIVVSGGTGALGRVVTRALLDAGAQVHVPVFEDAVPEGFDLGEHDALHLRCGIDLARERDAGDYFEQVPRPWATINLAGGFAMADLVDTSLADFELMWRKNVGSCFLACRESVRRMRETDEGGRIVNVAARPALVPTGGMVAYATAKGAVAALTRSLAEELAAEQIWVNAIAPSIIDTPANRAAMPDADHERWPTPAELADLISSLASPDNRCVRGAVIPVYGRA